MLQQLLSLLIQYAPIIIALGVVGTMLASVLGMIPPRAVIGVLVIGAVGLIGATIVQQYYRGGMAL